MKGSECLDTKFDTQSMESSKLPIHCAGSKQLLLIYELLN